MVSTSTDVQNALNTLGYGPLVVDGQLGPISQAATKAFQKDHSLTVDGIAGPQTKAALTAALAAEGVEHAVAAIAQDNASPPANVVATHFPPTPTSPAVTVHTDTTTGSTTAKPFGTPTSPTSNLAAATGAKPTARAPVTTHVAAMTSTSKWAWGGGLLAVAGAAWLALKGKKR